MQKNLLSLVSLFLIFSLKIVAQREPTKKVTFSSDIKKVMVDSEKGITLIKEFSKLSGYANDEEKVIWELGPDQIGEKSLMSKMADFDLGALDKDPDDIELIPNSDYIFASINDRDLIVNKVTGEMLFNSDRDLADMVVVKQMFLPYEDAFVFLTLKKKDFKVLYFDLKTKKVAWEIPAGKTAGLSSAFSKGQISRVDRAESFKGNIYTLVNNSLFAVESATGKLKWSLPDINKFFVCQNGKNLVIMKNKGGMMSSKKILNIVSIDNGKNIWEDDIQTARFLSLQDWGNKILVAHASGFNFYNLNDGSKVWKKDVKGSDFKQVLTLGDDFLYVSENEMILIDENGKPKWKNDIEISDNKEDLVYYLDKTKSGKVMYLTSTYGNMVDYVSGKKLWKKNIKFDKDKPLLFSYDEGKDQFLIYNDKDLYRFDPNVNDKPEPFAKVDAKSDKTMAGIELFDWGVSLTGQSEVIGIANDGKTVFQNEYKQPGEAGRKLLKAAGTVGSFYLGAKANAQSDIANTTLTMSYRDEKGTQHTSTSYLYSDQTRANLNNQASNNAAMSSAAATLTRNFDKRFNALKQNSQFAYIFAKDKSGDDNLKVLVKVNKATGKEEDKIIVDNVKPLYDIDASSNTVYYGFKNVLSVFK